MIGPQKPQGMNLVNATLRGHKVKAVLNFPRRAEGGVTPGTSFEGPSAPPPSELLAPMPPPRAPAQLAPHPPPISSAVPVTRPPAAFENYTLEDVSDAANKLVRRAALDLPTQLSFVSTEEILVALFKYWKEQSPFLRVVGTPPEGSWTYQDVYDGRVELDRDYAALLASAKKLWNAQTKEPPKRSEAEYVYYMSTLLTQFLDPEKISYYVDPKNISPKEVKLLQAFQDLANALLFYKSEQVVTKDKIVLLTNGARTACEKALDRFGDMEVPPVIQQYSQTLLTVKIDPAIARARMKKDPASTR